MRSRKVGTSSLDPRLHLTEIKEGRDEYPYRELTARVSSFEFARLFPGFAAVITNPHTEIEADVPHSFIITMNFPLEGMTDCAMSFDLHSSAVEEVAMGLFHIKVGSMGDKRYVRFNSDVKLIASDLTLKGASKESIKEWLGDEMLDAVSSGKMRHQEQEAGQNTYDCVSMMIQEGTDQLGMVTLTLDLVAASRISKRLKPYQIPVP